MATANPEDVARKLSDAFNAPSMREFVATYVAMMDSNFEAFELFITGTFTGPL